MKHILTYFKFILLLLLPFLAIGQQNQGGNRKLYFQQDTTMSRIAPTSGTAKSGISLLKSSAFIEKNSDFASSTSGVADSAIISNFSLDGSLDSSSIIVGIVYRLPTSGSTTDTIAQVRFGEQVLEKVIGRTNATNRTEFWLLKNPTSSTQNVVVKFSGTRVIAFKAIQVKNIDKLDPIGAVEFQSATATTISTSIQSSLGDLIIDLLGADGGAQAPAVTPSNQQNLIGSIIAITSGNERLYGGLSSKNGESPSTTLGWTWTGSSSQIIQILANFRGNSTTQIFKQAPAVCSPTTIEANKPIEIETYLTNISGSLGATAGVTARLRSGLTDQVVFEMPMATYNSSSGKINWSGQLTSDYTLAAGDSLQLEIAHDSTALSFQIQFADPTKPSFISLPIIDVGSNAIGMYNAAWSAGSAITKLDSNTTSGTQYLRDTVRSVFGSYSLANASKEFIIRNGSGSFDQTFAPTRLADSVQCSETYEYNWTISSTTPRGDYYLISNMGEGDDSTIILRDSIVFSLCGTNDSLTVTPTNPTCSNTSGGSVAFSLSNAININQYTWSYSKDMASAVTGTGTPITGLSAGNYDITVTSPTGCVYTKTGITLAASNTVSAASSSPTVCINTAITNITHTTTGATGIGTPVDLPNGVTATFASNTITISGTPSVSGTFNYSIPLTGGCGGTINATGTIVVNPINTVGSASSTPTVSINSAMTSITHSTTGATGIGTSSGLPTGVTATWATNTITISGTPTTCGTFNYTIPLTGGCGAVSATGTIIVISSNPPELKAQITNNCSGTTNTGKIKVLAIGGNSPFSYDWTGTPTGDGTNEITGLTNGSYTVTVTDGGGCTSTGTFTVGTTPAITVTPTITHESCPGGNGSITLAVTGGSAGPFAYFWKKSPSTDTIFTSKNINNVTGGTYLVNVKDSTGCSVDSTFTVNSVSLASCNPTPTARNDKFVSQAGTSINGNLNTNDSLNGESVTYTLLGSPIPSDTGTFNLTEATGAFTFTPAANFFGLISREYKVCLNDDSNICDTATLLLDIYPVGRYDTICYSSRTKVFSVPFDPMVDSYTWTIPQGAIINGSSTTNNVEIDFSGVTPNTYLKVCVKAVNVCGESMQICDSIFLSLPPLQITAPPVCEGGDLQLSVDYGTKFTWSGPNSFVSYAQNPLIFDATTALDGKYIVEVTDQYGCMNKDSVNITINSPPVISGTVINKANCALANGSIDLTVTSGTSPYTYLWSRGDITQDLLNALSDAYSVTVTDANGCQADSIFALGDLEGPTINLTPAPTNPSCWNLTDGTINITLPDARTYYFKWSNGSTTQNLTGLAAGEYSVIITDSITGCEGIAASTLIKPDSLIVEDSLANVACFSGTSGKILLNVLGGTGIKMFTWSGTGVSASAEDQSSLGAGSYSVIVKDAKNCSVTKSYTLTQPTALAASDPIITNATCNGSSNGRIDINPTGGTAPYTFQWVSGSTFSGPVIETTEDIHSKAAGAYTVRITDANSCFLDSTFTIAQPSALTASINTHNEISCFGGSDGKIKVTASGGTAGYTYLWSIGGIKDSLDSLQIGTYTVTVTDANNCSQTASVTLIQPTELEFTSVTAVQPSCFGGANGQLNIGVSGGTTTYSYLWSNAQTSNPATGLSAGTHQVTVTDAKGCKKDTALVLGQPTALSLTSVSTNINCNAGTTGAINITPAGGTTAYTYSWTSNVVGFTTQTSQDLTSLKAGTYYLSLTDGNSCVLLDTFILTEPSSLTISAMNPINPSCNESADGSLSPTISGGTLPYSFSWSNGATSKNISGLSAVEPTSFTITVMDSKGCMVNSMATLTAPVALAISGESETATKCFGSADGALSFTVSGGTTPLTYLWSDGSDSLNSRSGLVAGTYRVQILDSKNCSIRDTFTITQPTALALSATTDSVSCYGGSTGNINLTVTGGTSAYTYNWGSGITTEDRTNVVSGSYSVTVTDANLCTASLSVSVGQPDSIRLDTTIIDVTCNGAANGQIAVFASGGTGSFSYNWTGVSSSSNIVSSLAAGSYSVTVTDEKMCTKSAPLTITEPTAITGTITNNNVTCFGLTNGSVTSSVTGGTGTLGYLWNTGDNTTSIINIDKGIYSLTITDANNCKLILKDTVTAPTAPLKVDLAPVDVSCFGLTDGRITAVAYGGTPGYSYDWSDTITSTTPVASGLPAGTFSIIVTDAQGCTATNVDSVLSPTQFTATVSTINRICADETIESSIAINSSGGTEPYIHLWPTSLLDSGDLSNPNVIFSNEVDTLNIYRKTSSDTIRYNDLIFIDSLSVISQGTYSIKVTDFRGCEQNLTATISDPICVEGNLPDPDINVTYVNDSVFGNVSLNDSLLTGSTFGTPVPKSSNPSGGMITMGTDGKYNFIAPNSGVYCFEVPVCEPSPSTVCVNSLLEITVLPLGTSDETAPPIANVDFGTTLQNMPVTLATLSNDYPFKNGFSLVPGTVDTIMNGSPKNGTITKDPVTGNITYTPNSNFVGVDTLRYKVCDNQTPALCDTALQIIRIFPTGTANSTQAADDYAFTESGRPVNGNVKTNDTDPEGNPTTVTPLDSTIVGVGRLVLQTNGTYTFTPVPGYSGPVNYPYQVCDNQDPPACAFATLYIVVAPFIPDPDVNVTYVGDTVGGNVNVNDVVPPGTTYGNPMADGSNPPGGMLTLNPNGTYTFVSPNPGVYTYQVEVCAPGQSSPCPKTELKITVLPYPEPDTIVPPVANHDVAYSKGESVVLKTLDNDRPGDSSRQLDSTSVMILDVLSPTIGTVSRNTSTGDITFTPYSGFYGVATYTYKVCDKGTPVLCDTAIQQIYVLSPTTPNSTQAADDYAYTNGGIPVSGSVKGNDYDPENHPTTVTALDSTIAGVGRLVLQTNGTYTFTPVPGYSGPVNYPYQICDNQTPPACARATLYILVAPFLPDPDNNVTFVNDTIPGNIATNDDVPKGTTYNNPVANTSNPPGGELMLNPDGTYKFVSPNPGVYTYLVEVCAPGQSSPCPVTELKITVLFKTTDPTLPPVANNDVAYSKGQPVTLLTLANDLPGDPRRELDTMSVMILTGLGPANGTAVKDTATGNITYTPNSMFYGTDSLYYKVCDKGSPVYCDTALQVIHVLPPTAPNTTQASDDYASVKSGNPAVGNVKLNDYDPEGHPTAVTPIDVVVPNVGRLILNANGSYIFYPNGNFTGNTSFVYEICDDRNPKACAKATLYITILPELLPSPDINTTWVSVPLNGNVGTNDKRIFGTTYALQGAVPGNPGSALPVMNANGTYTFVSSIPGVFNFNVLVCPPLNYSEIGCRVTLLTIYVIEETLNNNPPVAHTDIGMTRYQTAVTLPTLSNDRPGDVAETIDSTSVTIAVNPSNGTATVNPLTGDITYTPNNGFSGNDTLTYKVCLKERPTVCSEAKQIITVLPLNSLNRTSASDDYYFGLPNQNISGFITQNDLDPEGDDKAPVNIGQQNRIADSYVGLNQPVPTKIITQMPPPSQAQRYSLSASLVEFADIPSVGKIYIYNDGSFTFEPVAGFFGPYNYVYRQCDNGTPIACADATIYILYPRGPSTDVNVACMQNFTVPLDEECNATLTFEMATLGSTFADFQNKYGPTRIYVSATDIPARLDTVLPENAVFGGEGNWMYGIYYQAQPGSWELYCWGTFISEDKIDPAFVGDNLSQFGTYRKVKYSEWSDVLNEGTFQPHLWSCWQSTNHGDSIFTWPNDQTRTFDTLRFTAAQTGVLTIIGSSVLNSGTVAPAFDPVMALYNKGGFDHHNPCQNLIGFGESTFIPNPLAGLGYANNLTSSGLNGANQDPGDVFAPWLLHPHPMARIEVKVEAGQSYTLLMTHRSGFTGSASFKVYFMLNNYGADSGIVDSTGLVVDSTYAYFDFLCTDLDAVRFNERKEVSQERYTGGTLSQMATYLGTDTLRNKVDSAWYSKGQIFLGQRDRNDTSYVDLGQFNISGNFMDSLLYGYGFMPMVIENCETWQVSIMDSYQSFGDCGYDEGGLADGKNIAGILTRTYLVNDLRGKTDNDTAIVKMYFRNPNLYDLRLPHYTVNIECDEITGEGLPSPAVTGYPFISTLTGFVDLTPNNAVCNLAAAYQDKAVVTNCANNKEFRREWTIYDWCRPGTTVVYHQLIRMGDFTAPVISQTTTLMTTNFNADGCTGSVTITRGSAQDLCGSLSMGVKLIDLSGATIAYSPQNLSAQGQNTNTGTYGTVTQIPGITASVNAQGTMEVRGLVEGKYYIEWEARDACGNASTERDSFTITDNISPSCVIDDLRTITLTDFQVGGNAGNANPRGEAYLTADRLDEGSWDNCHEVSVQIRRMTSTGMTAWGNEVGFTCADEGDSVLVEMVARAGADSTICWTYIKVEDKTIPECREIGTVTMLCSDLPAGDLSAGSSVWNQFFADSITVTKTSVRQLCNIEFNANIQTEVNIDQCGYGWVNRYYRVYRTIDNKEYADTCRMSIVFSEDHDYWVTFPADEANGDCESLEEVKVTFHEGGCDLITISKNDEQFDATADECYKILRTYRVINWCEYNVDEPAFKVARRDWNRDGFMGDATTVNVKYREGVQHEYWDYKGRTITVPGAPNSLNPDGTGQQSDSDIRDTVYRVGEQAEGGELVYWESYAPIKKSSILDNGDVLSKRYYFSPLYYLNGSTYTPAGFFEYTQHLKVYDEVAPELEVVTENLNFASYSNDKDKECPAPVGIMVKVSDECTSNLNNLVIREVLLDRDNNNSTGSITFLNKKYDASTSQGTTLYNTEYADGTLMISSTGLPIGEHKFTVVASDGCGNVKTEDIVIKVEDKKGPAPICIEGFAVELMLPSGEAMVSASDFVINSPIEDCSGDTEAYLITRMRRADGSTKTPAQVLATAGTETIMTLTCADRALNQPIQVAVIATDGEGNKDYCITTINVQDNLAPCPDELVSIEGMVATEEDYGIQGVQVSISGGSTSTTNGEGRFILNGILRGSDITISGNKEGNLLDGLSTLDLILITKHILGERMLQSPYKLLAADLNGSGHISTLDLIVLRRIILGIEDRLSGNRIWKFIPAEHQFVDFLNPWKFGQQIPEVLNLNNVSSNALGIAMIGVKAGDVNNSAVLDIQPRTNETFFLEYEEQFLQKDQKTEILISANTHEVDGFQGALEVKDFEIDRMEYLGMKEEFFGIQQMKNGIILMSWNGKLEDKGLFKIHGRAKSHLRLSEIMSIKNGVMKAESYTLSGEIGGLNLRYNLPKNFADRLFLGQNSPNPFKEATSVLFYIPESGVGKFTISDITGRVVKVIQMRFDKGWNNLNIGQDEVPYSGVYTYKLEINGESMAKKMIRLE